MSKRARTKTARAATTGTPESHDERISKALGRLEGDVCDLGYMAVLATSFLEDLISPDPTPITGKSDLYRITQQSSATALFALFHLEQMTLDFQKKYYAALRGEDA